MKKLLCAGSLLLSLPLLTSCMSFSNRALSPVANSIQEQLPQIHLEKEFALSLGNGVFSFLDLATGINGDLSAMDHVHIAVYNVSQKGRSVDFNTLDFNTLDFNTLDFESTLLARDKRLHWETIVKVRKSDEQVWVLVGMDLRRQSLDAVAVFSLERDELVLINVDGDLEQLLRFAMLPAQEHRDSLRSDNPARI